MYGNITTKKRLYEMNKVYWGRVSCDVEYDEGYICIAHTLSFHLQYNMLLDIIAKGIQEKTNLPVFAFSTGEKSCSFVEGDQSFGIEGEYVDVNNYTFGEKYDERKPILESLANDSFCDKNVILDLKYRDVKCGDAIWDTIICLAKDFDCTQLEYKNHYELLNRAFAIVDMAYDIFQQYTPKYLVTDEAVRMDGLFASVAARYGSKIVLTSLVNPDAPVIIEPEEFLQSGYLYPAIGKRISGIELSKDHDHGEKNFAYQLFGEGKKALDGIPIMNGKKNAFIMLHVLDDVPRAAGLHTIYRDYAEWFVDTMDMIKAIPGVNWIIRDHPHASGKRQRKYVKDFFECNRNESIYWCEDSVKRDDIANIADVIITYAGDVGLEYWALGIPTITLGEAYYLPHNISYRMKSKEEYLFYLQHVENIKKPSQESKDLANNILIKLKALAKTDDELACLFREIHNEEMKGIKYELRDYDLYDYEFIVKYLELIKEDKIRSSRCYQIGDMGVRS